MLSEAENKKLAKSPNEEIEERKSECDIYTEFLAQSLSVLCHILEPALCLWLWKKRDIPPQQSLFVVVSLQSFRVLYFMTQYDKFFAHDFWQTLGMGLCNFLFMPFYAYLIYKAPLTATFCVIYIHAPYLMSLGMAYIRDWFWQYFILMVLIQTSLVFLCQPQTVEGLPDFWIGFRNWELEYYNWHLAIAASWAFSCYYMSLLFNNGRSTDQETIYVTTSIMGLYMTKSFATEEWSWTHFLNLDTELGFVMALLCLVSIGRAVVPMQIEIANPHKILSAFGLVIPASLFLQMSSEFGTPNSTSLWAIASCIIFAILMGFIRIFAPFNSGGRGGGIGRYQYRTGKLPPEKREIGEPPSQT